jgi:serine/threonine protein kinase
MPPFANGSIIAGKYLIEETLAEGGIGVVVLAKHLALRQRVAIKYLKPKTLGNPAIVERFLREARLAAQITSEHVVSVYDVGTVPDGGPYMVMEYLVGEDLGRTIRGGPLPTPRAVDYILQACDALAEAHALGIVHRDIKPENLFVAQRASSTPILKIIDFGISKTTSKNGEDANWARQTAVNDRFGTPLYMSPEQLRSTTQVDARTDIWSLGVVLYELLTGVPPFGGDDLPQMCTNIIAGEPQGLIELRPSATPELEAIVLRCLEKDPAKRFRNVGELAGALAPLGPPNASSRAGRIAEIVRRGGGSVRPPAPPSSGSASTSAPAPAHAPAPPREGHPASLPPARITQTDARAIATVTIRRVVKRGRPAALAAIGGALCALAVMGGTAWRAAHTPAVMARAALQPLDLPRAAAPQSPSASSSAPPAAPDGPTVTLIEVPSATARAAAAAPGVSSSPAAAAPPRGAARPRAAPRVRASSAGAATPLPSDRRTQFGERE